MIHGPCGHNLSAWKMEGYPKEFNTETNLLYNDNGCIVDKVFRWTIGI